MNGLIDEREAAEICWRVVEMVLKGLDAGDDSDVPLAA